MSRLLLMLCLHTCWVSWVGLHGPCTFSWPCLCVYMGYARSETGHHILPHNLPLMMACHVALAPSSIALMDRTSKPPTTSIAITTERHRCLLHCCVSAHNLQLLWNCLHLFSPAIDTKLSAMAGSQDCGGVAGQQGAAGGHRGQ